MNRSARETIPSKKRRSHPDSYTCFLVPGQTPNFSPSSAKTAAGNGTSLDVIRSISYSAASTLPNGMRYRSRSLPGKTRTDAPLCSVM